ncbi:MAG: DUF362 domain-containing protein [Methanoregulaceae archaeon]|jgi:uncharacterized protein (DUF362 family)/Pyruvate/2-oxoacid:ferredoxin oxidoreductase delta subunit|nr:DUF362 domain-containing protein [Methanoregulaceae archaeon]MCU0628567.1 DUF362 domain-containing protein [Methanoregulaceae archaeon]
MGDPRIVSAIRCATYDKEEVINAVRKAAESLGGIESYISRGSRVLVKPNLLQGLSPDRCVTTHPAVVGAVCTLLGELGCKVVIADSPGGGIRYTQANLRSLYHAAGYDIIAEDTGAELNYDTSFYDHFFPEGRYAKRFPVISPVKDCDHILVVSKAKTHLWTLFSGGAKNLFGVIPGLEKPIHHARFRDPLHFGGMILDLNEALMPSLQIMDGIIAMEGDGPSSGTPRPLGLILASPDWTAIDSIACRMIGIPPLDVPTIKAAIDRGDIRSYQTDILLTGDASDFQVTRGFRLPSTYRGEGKGVQKNLLLSTLHNLGRLYTYYPVLNRSRCEQCGRCAMICPVKAISFHSKIPEINRKTCIRCYCCHEICPAGAIQLKPGLARWIIPKVTGLIMNGNDGEE